MPDIGKFSDLNTRHHPHLQPHRRNAFQRQPLQLAFRMPFAARFLDAFAQLGFAVADA